MYFTMSNYWRLKLIPTKSMGERESFRYCVNFMVNTFKEDAEKGISHLKIPKQLSEPPFTKQNMEDNDASTSTPLEDEVESSRRN